MSCLLPTALKRKIKNWCLISLLDIDTKIISKVIPNWLKKINILINENQTVCLDNRFINEGGRLISHIVDITYS